MSLNLKYVDVQLHTWNMSCSNHIFDLPSAVFTNIVIVTEPIDSLIKNIQVCLFGIRSIT